MKLAGTVGMGVLWLAIWAAPAIALPQENPPAQEAPAAPEATPSPSGAQTSVAPQEETQKKSSTKKTKRHHKPATKADSGTTPKKVVHNGGTAEPIVQIAPGMSDAQASQNRQGTAQLLATTDANLKKLDGQQLDLSKQDVVKQIQTYVEQARTAEAAGDLDRAHNLAVKAQLLSDDLVRH